MTLLLIVAAGLLGTAAVLWVKRELAHGAAHLRASGFLSRCGGELHDASVLSSRLPAACFCGQDAHFFVGEDGACIDCFSSSLAAAFPRRVP